MSDQTLFDQTQNQIDPEKDYTEELVGEGKKFSDVAALARGKMESDQHIESLQREMKELREDLEQRVQVNELLEEIKGLRKPNEETEQMSTPATPGEGEKPSITSEDIETLVSQKLAEANTLEAQERNLNQVKDAMSKAWGSDAGAKLAQASKDLGMSASEIDSLAKERPNVLLKALQLDRKTDSNDSLFKGDTNSARFDQPVKSGKTEAYYQKMRKEDPSRYHSVAVQAEMHREALRQGEAFFDAN